MRKTLFVPLFLSLILGFCVDITRAENDNFPNPLLSNLNLLNSNNCNSLTIKTERFGQEVKIEDQIKLCLAIERVISKLKQIQFSSELREEITTVWNTFAAEKVTIRLMPKESPSRLFAMAQPSYLGRNDNAFESFLYIRLDKLDDPALFLVFLHELRHVYDFYETWKTNQELDSLLLEQRAFTLMSKVTEETDGKEKLKGVPSFWKSNWKNKSKEQVSSLREQLIGKYLQSSKFYRQYSAPQNDQEYKSSFLNTSKKPDKIVSETLRLPRDKVRLPDRPLSPDNTAPLTRKKPMYDFTLVKPLDSKDEKEILKAAIANEKKLYYGMANFIYEQKQSFQCWEKNRIHSVLDETYSLARTDQGKTLISSVQSVSKVNQNKCHLNFDELRTDFTDTFWASPGLDQMSIKFIGFVNENGQKLARYVVEKPDQEVYNKLAQNYPFIRPFRIFFGSIFVSPDDGQIVKFWGTSFPEDNITGQESKKIIGSYSVTALRQKLNEIGGVWVTSFIGTSALASTVGKQQPFSYTIKFENYREAITDVKIFDEDVPDRHSISLKISN